ncbi:conjugal transfer protein TraG N-terminal domain-containing protein [Sulfurospirillum multivorans]|uniref:TraG-like protein n=2 Tax=Sulfurospirillum multivorans TaxID=66821 RepID=A0AA86AJJ4_SULMK|nr:conjugal transfer protein TraG N-terminal domain-containing protein [Sulfurospirillum multivorans]AHJ11694.1 TraG-like protein [Sulfurospirillum multivorans DSM 12446]QEH05200.1 TraG-like protein [Sulfurospirillum multivorans]
MKKILFISTILSYSVLFGADNSDIIWTWGNGRNIASILSFLYFLLNIDTLAAIIKYAGLIGMLIVFIREYAKGVGFQPGAAAIKMLFFIIVSQITVYGFLSVERDDAHHVYILSANELSAASWQKCRPVSGDNECYAPIGVKMLMTYATNFERAGIGMMESSMMDANAMTYSFSRMGLGFGFTFYDHISKTKGDPYTYNTFMEFYENCIIYDLADGTKSVDGIYKSRDLASYILSPNARLTNVYSASNPNGTLKTCYEVSSAALWGNINCGSTAKKLQAKASGSAASEASTDDICLAAENFGQLMFNSTKDASAQIEQRTIMNLTNESIINSAIASGIDPNILAYGTTMADREQRSKFMVLGVMAKEWIPSMRGMMQGIALGLIWVLAILSIMTASPAPYLGSVVGFQVTLIVWSFILALINFMTIDKMSESLPNIFFSDLGAGDQMTLWSQPTFDEENQKALAFLGYMGFASYGIAASLVYMGGNKLAASFSGAVGQLSVGMGTSANMAKGHFDHGMDKSDSSGTQHHNARTGDLDRWNPDGSTSRDNLNGMNTSKKVDSTGTLETTTSINGKETTQIDTTGGNSAKYNGKDVTGTKLGSGTTGQLQSQVIASASKEAAQAKNDLETAEHNVQNATQSQHQVATDAITAASKAEGKDAITTKQEAEKRALSKSLDEMVANKEISSTDAKQIEQVAVKNTIGAGVNVDSSKSALGGIFAKTTGVSIQSSASIAREGSDIDQTTKSKQEALEKSFAEKFSKNYATEATAMVSNSSKLDATLKQDFTSKINDSFASTQSASDSYKHAQQVSDTATKKETYVKQNSATVAEDIATKYLQNVADNAGGGESGKVALRAELNKLESTRYTQDAFSTYADSIKDTTNVDTKINDTQAVIDHKKSELAPVKQQDHQENQNQVIEQHWLNEGEIKSQKHKNKPVER